MKYSELLDIVGNHPVFSSALLKVGDVDAVDIASQLSRWVAAGKLISLRRGVYVLPRTYARRMPHSFEVANALHRPSYVSLESALAFHGLIPEAVFATTSVTTSRPAEYQTPLGAFGYRHINRSMWWGYRLERFDREGTAKAFVARPEKALLDLAYLRAGSDRPEFVRQLRLERLDSLDLASMEEMASRMAKPKLIRFAALVREEAAGSAHGWEDIR